MYFVHIDTDNIIVPIPKIIFISITRWLFNFLLYLPNNKCNKSVGVIAYDNCLIFLGFKILLLVFTNLFFGDTKIKTINIIIILAQLF